VEVEVEGGGVASLVEVRVEVSVAVEFESTSASAARSGIEPDAEQLHGQETMPAWPSWMADRVFLEDWARHRVFLRASPRSLPVKQHWLDLSSRPDQSILETTSDGPYIPYLNRRRPDLLRPALARACPRVSPQFPFTPKS